MSHLPIDPDADSGRRAWLPCPNCHHGDGCDECQSEENCATHWQYLLRNEGVRLLLQCPVCASLWTVDTSAVDVAAGRDGPETSEHLVETISLGSLAFDVGIRPDSDRVYVLTAGSLKVISRFRHVVGTIAIGREPKHIIVSADGSRLYVTGYDGALSIVNPIDMTAKTFVGQRSVAEVASPDGKYVYLAYGEVVGDGSSTWIAVIRTDGAKVALIPVERRATGLAVSPDGSRLYVASSGHSPNSQSRPGSISVIDTDTYQVLDTITVPASPDTVTVTPDGSLLYVTHYDADAVSVIDPASRNVTTVTVDDAPLDVALSPHGTAAYVTCLHSIAVIDAAAGVADRIAIGDLPRRVHLSIDGKYAYAIDFANNRVWVLRTADNSVIGSVEVGGRPQTMALSHDEQFLYFCDYAGTLTVIPTAWIKPHSESA